MFAQSSSTEVITNEGGLISPMHYYSECPLLNKTYIWANSNIEFLESGKMKAFGLGKYRFIDKHLVKCDFGNREHLLKFDKDYSKFISVRKGDFEVVAGNILQNPVHA